jgi:uncharacterized protein
MAEITVSLLFFIFLVLGVGAGVRAEAPRYFQGVTLMQDNSSESAVSAASSQHASYRRPNRLIREKSPYLLQHAYNPVDWFAWGPEAFQKASEEDKPILLSIGYSTCHWCHVMERESFEDEETARLMNEAFVSIKVDREERPDIDHVYMTVCQMMTGGGGWPLNVIMTPDKRPFYAGTYFPRESVNGRIGMRDLARRIREVWTSRREDVLQSSDKVMLALSKIQEESPGHALGKDVLDKAYRELSQRYDTKYGGFSGAPKFPTAHNMLFMLRFWKSTGDGSALDMVEHTLQSMRQGGIYDHVGFGFHRYSTDERWLVPHFEKMLYDQALLSLIYTEAYQATGKNEYAKTAGEILTYVLRDMTAPEGGFYSAEDADSEGVEGKFYVWKEEEIRHILDKSEAELVLDAFSVLPAGNFHEEASGRLTGDNILHVRQPLSRMAERLGLDLTDLETRLDLARTKLFRAREGRIRPHRDDKILTDWNGLMVVALARAAQVLGNSQYLEAAKKAAEFVLTTLRAQDGRLLHRYRDGEAGLSAHVDDYAFFIWGLLELYEASFDARYLQAALKLNTYFLEHFWDAESGGLYFTSDESEDLPVRKKEIYDGATPSGNSVAALNFLRLGRITANPELESKAALVGQAFSQSVNQMPSAYTMLLTAVQFALGPSSEVVISGRTGAEDTRLLLQELRRYFLPNKVVLLHSSEIQTPEIETIAPYTKNLKSIDGRATAYVCANFSCELPTDDPKKMLEVLELKGR